MTPIKMQPVFRAPPESPNLLPHRASSICPNLTSVMDSNSKMHIKEPPPNYVRIKLRIIVNYRWGDGLGDSGKKFVNEVCVFFFVLC